MSRQEYDCQDNRCLADEVTDPHQEHRPGPDVEPCVQFSVQFFELSTRQLLPVFQHEDGRDEWEQNEYWVEDQRQHRIRFGPIVDVSELNVFDIQCAAYESNDITLDQHPQESSPNQVAAEPLFDLSTAFIAIKPVNKHVNTINWSEHTYENETECAEIIQKEDATKSKRIKLFAERITTNSVEQILIDRICVKDLEGCNLVEYGKDCTWRFRNLHVEEWQQYDELLGIDHIPKVLERSGKWDLDCDIQGDQPLDTVLECVLHSHYSSEEILIRYYHW